MAEPTDVVQSSLHAAIPRCQTMGKPGHWIQARSQGHTAKEQIYCLVGESDSGLEVAPIEGAKAIGGGDYPREDGPASCDAV